MTDFTDKEINEIKGLLESKDKEKYCGIITSTNPPGLSKKRIRVDICRLAPCFIGE